MRYYWISNSILDFENHISFGLAPGKSTRIDPILQTSQNQIFDSFLTFDRILEKAKGQIP